MFPQYEYRTVSTLAHKHRRDPTTVLQLLDSTVRVDFDTFESALDR
jgi:hypothetical protein